MIVLLLMGILVALVFGKSGIAAMKGLASLAIGLVMLIVAAGIL
jgi:hypothetical protein